MGITEIEALALILGGAFLVGAALAKVGVEDRFSLIVLIGGLAMLLFGIADIAVDHL